MSPRKLKLLKTTAVFLVVTILSEVVFPSAAYALTAGPSSPEFSNFTPVATTDMVNVFSGDLNYNLPVIEIPGSDGGGYALSLSYQSGASSEEEASWVGYGWTLNPGSINRNTRGFPDDYNNAPVTLYNKTRPNWSITNTKEIGLQVFGKDQANVGVSASVITRVNNNQGYYVAKGFGFSVLGLGLQLNSDPNGVTFSADVNPSAWINKNGKSGKKKTDNSAVAKTDKNNNTESKTQSKASKKSNVKGRVSGPGMGSIGLAGSNYGLFTYSEAVRAASLTQYNGAAFNNGNVSLCLTGNLPIGIHKQSPSSFNMQYNIYENGENVYGYMYTPSTPQKGVHSDYFVEKDQPFSKRNYYLGIPFNNADIFNVSGEGIGGGFQFYPNTVGQFYPNKVTSLTDIFQIGFQFNVGDNVGAGVNFGVGVEANKVKEWITGGNFSSDGIFRFNNDLGGEAEYATSGSSINAIDVASLNYNKLSPPGTKQVSVSSNGQYNLNETGRSSFIDYHTFGNVGKGFTNDFTLTGFDANTVAEMCVYNEEGMRYVYSQPVFTRNETNLQIDVKASVDKIKNRYLAYKNLLLQNNNGNYQVDPNALSTTAHNTVVGEIRNQPYASSYLLSAITTHDYVDVNSNGLDDQDFGGWTKFNYRQAYGLQNNNWYRYRSPYNGLLYQQNQVSDLHDDLGSVITGEKEIYYLDHIETKSHIAYFVTNKSKGTSPWLTGSGKKRLDALGATKVTGYDPAAPSEGAKGSDELEYLEKIVLFAKDRPDKPIKVVRMEYDYSLVQNLPNNFNGDYPAPRNDFNNLYNTSNDLNNPSGSGKLTLKRVWFEYEGTILSKVSPYEFHYEYASSGYYQSSLKTLYGNILSYGDSISSDAQNPDYSPYLLDQWGYAQPYGAERHNDGINTRYQGLLPATKGNYGWRSQILPNQPYDPAAWQLKRIKLPSGGEIHIQYEEKDYAYVQDRPVMGLASLIPGAYKEATNLDPVTGNVIDGVDPYYVVDPSDLGADQSNLNQVTTLVNKINQLFNVKQGQETAEEKVYFKFLYGLTGSSPSLDVCNSEYISGYANLQSASVYQVRDGFYGIKITLGSEASTDGAYATIPRQACVKYVTTQREGKLNPNDCSTPVEAMFDGEVIKVANRNQSKSVSLSSVFDYLTLGSQADNIPVLEQILTPLIKLFMVSQDRTPQVFVGQSRKKIHSLSFHYMVPKEVGEVG
jgi:hypothetical protein